MVIDMKCIQTKGIRNREQQVSGTGGYVHNYLHQSCFMLPSLMNRDTDFMKIINNKETAGIRAAAWTIQLPWYRILQCTWTHSVLKKQIVVSGAVRRHWNKTFF
jgi:hypothetical protein